MANCHGLAYSVLGRRLPNGGGGGTMFNRTKASGKFPAGKYPMHSPDMADRIGFSIPPCGKYTGNT